MSHILLILKIYDFSRSSELTDASKNPKSKDESPRGGSRESSEERETHQLIKFRAAAGRHSNSDNETQLL